MRSASSIRRGPARGRAAGTSRGNDEVEAPSSHERRRDCAPVDGVDGCRATKTLLNCPLVGGTVWSARRRKRAQALAEERRRVGLNRQAVAVERIVRVPGASASSKSDTRTRASANDGSVLRTTRSRNPPTAGSDLDGGPAAPAPGRGERIAAPANCQRVAIEKRSRRSRTVSGAMLQARRLTQAPPAGRERPKRRAGGDGSDAAERDVEVDERLRFVVGKC